MKSNRNSQSSHDTIRNDLKQSYLWFQSNSACNEIIQYKSKSRNHVIRSSTNNILQEKLSLLSREMFNRISVQNTLSLYVNYCHRFLICLCFCLIDATGITSLIMAPNANLNSTPVGSSNSVTPNTVSLGVTTNSVINAITTGSPPNQEKSKCTNYI